MSRGSSRTSSTARCSSTGTPRAADAAHPRPLRPRGRGADRRPRDRSHASASRAARAWSTTGTSTCPAARSSTARSRPRPRARSPTPSSRPSRIRTWSDGVRFVFSGGRVVEASASSGEDALLAALDRDEGARVLGRARDRLQPGIQRHMRNTLFDEKIDGTIHLAIGAGIPTRAARTSRPRTGTWSRTCATAAGSSSTARSSRRTASGRSSELDVVDRRLVAVERASRTTRSSAADPRRARPPTPSRERFGLARRRASSRSTSLSAGRARSSADVTRRSRPTSAEHASRRARRSRSPCRCRG